MEKTIAIVPEICQGESPKATGTITLTVPTNLQRMEYASTLGIKIGQDGEADLAEGSEIQVIVKMIKMSQAHYKEVAIVKPDGTEHKSFDDLNLDSDMSPILVEVARKVMGGFVTSKNSTP